MKHEITIFIGGLLCGLIVAAILFFQLSGLQGEIDNYQRTTEQLHAENRNIEIQLTEAKGIIRGVADKIETSTKEIESINNGLESGGDLIEASLAIIEELLRAVSDIEDTVSPQPN